MIKLEDLAATPWRQLLHVKRPAADARFYESTRFPEVYKRVMLDGSGHASTRYACDDDVVPTLSEIVSKLNAGK